MRIAVIGGSGFVGSRLIGLLQTVPDIELLNIDKQQSELYPHLTQLADVLDGRKLKELLAGIDLVVLLAAEHKDNVTPTSLYYTVNVEGMRNTLQAGMVTELLEFTRIQDGRFNLRLELIDIAAELEDALFTYGELMKQSGMEVNYSAPPGEIPLIPGDPERLKQVFCNLLDNAAKHGCDGERIDVKLREESDYVRISFRDYGHGIPAGELPHVKEKFYKGSSKNRGTGIGLSVCDEIITRHGGQLTVANAADGGCIVSLTLPLSAA